MKRRLLWIDVARILATWGIICLHTRAVSYYEVDCFSATWLIICGWGEIVKWAVPVFIMISGVLMIERDIPLNTLYGHNIGKLLGAKGVSCLTMFLIYVFYTLYFGGFSLAKCVKMAFMDNAMWFIFMMIGLYMIQPFLRIICQKREMIEYFLILGIVFSVIFPLSEVISGFVGETIKNTYNSMYFYFTLGYITYFVLGHYLYKYCKGWKKIRIMFVIAAIGSCFFNIFVDASYIRYDKKWIQVLHDQTITIGTFIFSVSVFMIFILWEEELNNFVKRCRLEAVIHRIGKNCIGIYVLHWPILTVLSWFNVVPSKGRYLIGVPVETTLIFISCFLCTLLWGKIPILCKVLG